MADPVAVMQECAEVLNGKFRRTQKNVPHVIAEKDGVMHSICFFGKGNFFRVWWPWPGGEQEQCDFKTLEDLKEYFDA